MKKRLIAVSIILIFVFIFFFAVHIIKNVQNRIEKRSEGYWVEELLTGESYQFEQMINKVDFGKVTQVVSDWQKVKGKSPFYDTPYATDYYFDEKIAKEIVEVLKRYSYGVCLKDIIDGVDSSGQISYLGNLQICGYEGYVLKIVFYDINDEGMVAIGISLRDQNNNIIDTNSWFNEKMYQTLLVKKDILVDLKKCLDQNVEKISLEMAEEAGIKADDVVMETQMFLQYQHEMYKEYTNHQEKECYLVYRLPLEDEEGYLLVYRINLEVMEGNSENGIADIGKVVYQYIFQVEYYDKENKLIRELYNDRERYDRDRVK